MEYIVCLLFVNNDNKFVTTVYDEMCLVFLSFYGPVCHLMMAEIDSRICSGIE